MRKLLKANNECFQRPIEIKIEQPSIHGKDHSVVQIEDENVHKTQVLNSKGMQHQHTLRGGLTLRGGQTLRGREHTVCI